MKDFTDIKKNLETEYSELRSELETIAVENTETGDWIARPTSGQVGNNADENVAADNTEEWNERRALMAQLEIRYNNIKKALAKFITNSFGYCELCNEQIEDDRLLANNSARTCKVHIERGRELPM